MSESGFETIDASEFEAATKPAPRKKTATAKNLERTQTNWFFNLHTQLGECTMPQHMEVMEALGQLEKEYRRVMPIRMVLKLDEDGMYICRDCWLEGY